MPNETEENPGRFTKLQSASAPNKVKFSEPRAMGQREASVAPRLASQHNMAEIRIDEARAAHKADLVDIIRLLGGEAVGGEDLAALRLVAKDVATRAAAKVATHGHEHTELSDEQKFADELAKENTRLMTENERLRKALETPPPQNVGGKRK